MARSSVIFNPSSFAYATNATKTVNKVDKVSTNETVTKFVREQINNLLHNPKLKELVERVSFREDVSKDRVLKTILENMANETEQASKKTISI